MRTRRSRRFWLTVAMVLVTAVLTAGLVLAYHDKSQSYTATIKVKVLATLDFDSAEIEALDAEMRAQDRMGRAQLPASLSSGGMLRQIRT